MSFIIMSKGIASFAFPLSNAIFSKRIRFTFLLFAVLWCLPKQSQSLELVLKTGFYEVESETNILLHCLENPKTEVSPTSLPNCEKKTFRWYKNGKTLWLPKYKKYPDNDCLASNHLKRFVVQDTVANSETTDCVSQLLIRRATKEDAGKYSCSLELNEEDAAVVSNQVQVDVLQSIVISNTLLSVEISEEHNNLDHLNSICENPKYSHANIEDEESYSKRAHTVFTITVNDSRLFDSNFESSYNNVAFAEDAILVMWNTRTLHKFNQHLESFEANYPITVLRFKSEIMYFCDFMDMYVHVDVHSPVRLSIVFNRFVYRWPVNCTSSAVDTTGGDQEFPQASGIWALNSVVMYIAIASCLVTIGVALLVFLCVRSMNRNMVKMRNSLAVSSSNATSTQESIGTINPAIPLLTLPSTESV